MRAALAGALLAALGAGPAGALGQEAASAAGVRQAPSVHAAVETGAVVLDGEFGLEGRAGAELRAGRLSVVARPVEVAVVPGAADPGYRWVTLSGGQRRCREAATGRFARDTRCIELEAEYGASAELAWRAGGGRRPVHLGAGFRAGHAAGPYGTVRWRPVPASGGLSWHLQAAAGPELLRLGAGAALRL